MNALADALQNVPVIGTFYHEVISGHSVLVYAAFAIVALTWWVLYRTRYGLRLRAVGENPAAVDTAGVSVKGLRFSAVMITGVLCGLAGAYMATALQAGFPAERIYFHGNNKTADELTMALESGVGRIVVDNIAELELLGALRGVAP